MNPDEIIAFFPNIPLAPTRCGAASYAVPTLAWLQGPFWDAFRARYWNRAEEKWGPRWKCRDFAAAYRVMATECWAESTGIDSDSECVAVGEFWFKPDLLQPLNGHAINPVFTENGLQFIDPQNNQLWQISPEQFASRYFVRF